MAALRDYQARVRDEVHDAWSAGARSVLAVLPTGGGKTVTGIETALGQGPVLWLAPRRELVHQAVEALRRAGVRQLGVHLAGAASGDRGAPVQVGTVQTLHARGARPPARVVVWDEAHHATASTYRAVREAYPDALHLGLTATPERSDRTPLGDVFGVMVRGPDTAEMVARGWLVPVDVWAPREYRERALAATVVEAWQAHGAGRPCVVFSASVAEAHLEAERLRAAGARAATVEGTMPARERAAALEAFADGRLDVLLNQQVLTEGWDCPRAEVMILARGCGAASTFLQMVGRVRRPAPGKASALLVDLRGVVHLHGLPDEPRRYALAGRAVQVRDGEEPIRQCQACQRWYRPSGTRACVHCGAVAPPRPRDPQEVRREELQRIRESATSARKAADWARLLKQARMMGYRTGWAVYRFHAKYGHGPTGLPGA